LDHVELPYVSLDATYLHVRNATCHIVSMAVVVATVITATAIGRSWTATSATAPQGRQ
jgi:hypothetical protein